MHRHWLAPLLPILIISLVCAGPAYADEKSQTERELTEFESDFEILPFDRTNWKALLHPTIRKRYGRGKKARYQTITPFVKYGVVLSGEGGYRENAKVLFPPASLSKFFTAGLALQELGGDFRYETVTSWNHGAEGSEAGYLLITGVGDPTLGTDSLANAIVHSLVDAGVKKLFGDVSFSSSDFRWSAKEIPSGWMSGEGLARIPDAFARVSHPKVKKLLTARLKSAGIQWNPEIVPPFPRDDVSARKFIFSSAPLRQILKPFMQNSVNYIGEALLLKVGELKGDKTAPTLLSAALPLLQDYATKRVGSETILLNDGSGLSRTSRATAEGLLNFLVAVKTEPYYSDFFASLAVMGHSGTVERRMPDSPVVAKRIHAKTGTLTRPNANYQIAGYLESPNRDPLDAKPYVILTSTQSSNGAYCRKAQDAALVAWAKSVRF